MKFPFYKQLDTMDCGPTCLKMLAQHYGKAFSISKLRDLSHITKEGVSMMGISYAAESIGMHTQGVKATYEQLRNDATLPVIVHWGQNHFVVV
ncbi:cysteine peptidase family C39 domain-containing protein [Roseivirga echinicomitans]